MNKGERREIFFSTFIKMKQIFKIFIAMKLKMSPGYMIQKIAGENVLIAGQSDNINCSRMLVLNDSAAELVQTLIDDEATQEELVNFLTENYVVEVEQAQKDVEELLAELNRQKVLKLVD